MVFSNLVCRCLDYDQCRDCGGQTVKPSQMSTKRKPRHVCGSQQGSRLAPAAGDDQDSRQDDGFSELAHDQSLYGGSGPDGSVANDELPQIKDPPPASAVVSGRDDRPAEGTVGSRFFSGSSPAREQGNDSVPAQASREETATSTEVPSA